MRSNSAKDLFKMKQYKNISSKVGQFHANDPKRHSKKASANIMIMGSKDKAKWAIDCKVEFKGMDDYYFTTLFHFQIIYIFFLNQ